MPELPLDSQVSELQFSTLVDEVKSEPARSALLVDLLREDHPIYEQRGAAATIRMRGWALLAFERLGLPEAALIFVLEELDNGRDAYLVAAAARSLRSYARPAPAMAAFLMRALANIQFHDDLVCLDHYGGYTIFPGDTTARGATGAGTTAINQLLLALRWLGSGAREAVPGMEALLADNVKGGGALSQTQLRELRGILKSLKSLESLESLKSPESPASLDSLDSLDSLRCAEPLEALSPHCCTLPVSIGSFRDWLTDIASNHARSSKQDIGSIVFEDQDGKSIKFDEFFRGQPSIVAFFYTRCTNPLKCSLTITKLARLQKLMADRGLDGQIRMAAITYDPQFDLAERLRGYGDSRGVRMDADNRLLRAVEGIEPMRKYFQLGVNFIQSLVNRHRVEVYILDATGSIAASFERIQWDESEVLGHAAALLASDHGRIAVPDRGSDGNESGFEKNSNNATISNGTAVRQDASASRPARLKSPVLPATLSILSLAAAFFPKCPVCWAAYLSVFGIAGLEQLPYSPWLLPLFACLMLINLGSLRFQQRSQHGTAGFYLAATGAFLIFVLGIGFELVYANAIGVMLTIAGSLLSVHASETPGRPRRRWPTIASHPSRPGRSPTQAS